MKTLKRNKSTFYYALYEDRTARVDEYGNETGEYDVLYGNPQEYAANISAAKGETSTRQFGENEGYDKVIAVDNEAPAIDEYAILWVDTMPLLDEEGALARDEDGNVITPHDYEVRKVAISLNSTLFAISKVNVSG